MKDIQRQALQLIQDDQWDAAHRLIQDYPDPLSCRIHGYLHRVEGDLANARYWYQLAGSDLPANSLEDEIKALFAFSVDP